MRDVESGFFFLSFSLFVLWESLQLGLGTFQKPGSGFLSFCVALLLTTLSLKTIRKGWGISEARVAYSRRVVLALVCIIVYSLVLESLGFIIATFFLVGIFFHLGEPRKWWLLLGMSGLLTLLVYLVFSILLEVPLPRGLLGM